MGHFLPFYPASSPKNQNFTKMKKKKHLEISSFYIYVPKIIIRWCTVPEICCVMHKWMGRWKEWHIEVGAPANNFLISLDKGLKKQKRVLIFKHFFRNSFHFFLCYFVYIWRAFLLNSMSNFQMNCSFIFTPLQFPQN